MNMQPAAGALAAIPWSHEQGDFGSVWKWITPHFEVTVTGNDRSCYFQVADKSANPTAAPKPLADGQAPTFEQAERQVRTIVGKSYDPALGYGIFAGSLATTFLISTGQEIDLGPFVGRTVEVTAVDQNGQEGTYTGVAHVRHYDLYLAGQQTLRISPSYIRTIRVLGQTLPVAVGAKADRTVRGSVEPGCTGKPGFMAGIVEHDGRTCPVHEENL